MNAGSDPVVIVSAARTVIGEWPAGSARGPSRDDPGNRRTLGTRRLALFPAGREASPSSSPGVAPSAPRAPIGFPGRATAPPAFPLAGGERRSRARPLTSPFWAEPSQHRGRRAVRRVVRAPRGAGAELRRRGLVRTAPVAGVLRRFRSPGTRGSVALLGSVDSGSDLGRVCRCGGGQLPSAQGARLEPRLHHPRASLFQAPSMVPYPPSPSTTWAPLSSERS